MLCNNNLLQMTINYCPVNYVMLCYVINTCKNECYVRATKYVLKKDLHFNNHKYDCHL